MSQKVESLKTAKEETAVEVKTKAEVYDLHIRLPNEMREKLRDAPS